MIVERKAGYLIFALESQDWKRKAKDFIEEIKENIPPEDREWNEENKQWYIKEKWSALFRSIRYKYFKDKNQEELCI